LYVEDTKSCEVAGKGSGRKTEREAVQWGGVGGESGVKIKLVKR
jgi:hypothetical protein